MICVESQAVSHGCEFEIVLQPWELRSFELTSWLQVLQFSANAFFWCGRALRAIKSDCLISSATTFGEKSVFVLSHGLDEQVKQKTISALSEVEQEFRKIGLFISADTAKDVLNKIQNPGPAQNCQWLFDQIEGIENLATKELQGKFFLYIPPERAKFWPRMKQPNLFGDEVATKFPSITFDVANSGICLATMMSTAAVFHLMRALEIGLAALGKVFNVSLEHKNWEPAINDIAYRIRGMQNDPAWTSLPDWKDQREFYSQAATHFFVLKDAWRNYTMHSRGKYTETEAERIFENVKGFMQKLAEKLSE